MAVLGFELRALHLLGRCSTPLNPFCSPYFGDRVSLFPVGQPGLTLSYFIPPAVAGMTGMCHLTQLLVEMKSQELFVWVGLKH
jgi:hypothetical protein